VAREGRLFTKNVASCKGESLSTASEFCLQAVRERSVQRAEAPLMGGGNYRPKMAGYNPLKVTKCCLKEIWLYAGKSEYPTLPTNTFGDLSG